MSSDNTLKLPEELSISNVAEWKARLAALLEQAPPLTLDAEELVRVDTAAIQMLAAFSAEASRTGTALTWHHPTDMLKTTAGQLGMTQHLALD
jgi:anti-anti-sigma regulatory factor